MRKISLVTLLLGTILFADTLRLDECIEKTLLHHPDIKTFNLKNKQSKFIYDSAVSDYLPQINLNANYNALQTFVFPTNGVFHTIDDDSWSAGASLKQKIWDFSKTTSNMAASKVDEDISKLSLKDIKALLVYKVKSLYELMVVQKEAISVRQKDIQSKQAYYQQSLAHVKQGLKTVADSSRFLSSVYLAKENLADSIASFKKAKNSLSLYMGENIPDDITLQSNTLKDTLDIKNTTEQAILDENYQLKIYSQNIQKNNLLYKSTKASHYGSIDAVASYNHINSLNEYDSNLLGVTLNIPLYSGGRIDAQTQNAQIATQIANTQKASKKLILQEEIENLLEDIRKYNQSIKTKKAQINSSKATKKLIDARYKEGLATYIEVLDATALQLDAKLGLLNAKYQLSSAIHRLEYLQGKIQ